MVFCLQTRTPAVLPPLCTLFGAGPSDPRPMQRVGEEQQFPDWRLLEVRLGWAGLACKRAGCAGSSRQRQATNGILIPLHPSPTHSTRATT